MAHAALGDHVLGEMLHLVGLAAQDGHLHAAVMVEMGVHRGERQLVMVVEGVGQPLGELPRVVVVDIDQRGHAIALLVERLGRLPDAGAGEVADRLRAVLIAAGLDDAIELGHELVVDGDGHALHGNSATNGAGSAAAPF